MIVNCEFSLSGKDYTCEVINVAIPSNEFRFQGEHKNEKCNDDVKLMIFKDCSIPQIPQGIGNIFENIERLSIVNSKIKSITKYDLEQFKNLKELNLNSNLLEFLPGNLFNFTKQIQDVNISYNKIKFIGTKLFDNLSHLKIVDLRGNIAINKYYNSATYSSLNDIEQHIYSHCKPPFNDNEMHKQYGRYHPNNFLDDMQKFITNDDLKDFTMKVGDREFKVHKLVFAARSETFAELIKNNPEAEDLVLQDISLEVFECVLSYVYTDQLPAETQNLHEVFAAAGKLKIKGLIIKAAKMLINSMENEKNLEILFKILSFSNKFEHDELRLKAFEEIKKHFPGSKFKDDLARQPEKLESLIDMRLKMNQKLKELEI